MYTYRTTHHSERPSRTRARGRRRRTVQTRATIVSPRRPSRTRLAGTHEARPQQRRGEQARHLQLDVPEPVQKLPPLTLPVTRGLQLGELRARWVVQEREECPVGVVAVLEEVD